MNYYEPSGDEVRALRLSVKRNRRAFAHPLRVERENIKTWETERRGVRMPAPIWHLARLTYDAQYLAKWLIDIAKNKG